MISILNASAQNGYSLELNIKTAPTAKITKNETNMAISFFKNIDSNNKITNTLEYKRISINYNPESYFVKNSTESFNSLENHFELLHQINNTINLNFEIKTIAGFESSLGFSDITFLGGISIDYKLNEENKFNLGVKRMTLFVKPEILPTFSFYHKFSPSLSIKLGFPNSSVSFSNNERNLFRLTNSFNGNFYNLDNQKIIDANNNASRISFSQMTSVLEYERNIDSNWYMNIRGGYDFNKKYIITDKSGETKSDLENKNGYIFNIGIKYKH
jgi:hypothetical protein